MNFQMFKLVLEKAEEPEIKLPTSIDSLKKQESSRKTSTLLHRLRKTLWLYGSWQILENSYRDGNTRPSYLPTMWVKKQQLEPYMEQLIGSKLGKEYDKAAYYNSIYLTYMQSISCEMLSWRSYKVASKQVG